MSRKEEIKDYLQKVVNPILKPIIQEISRVHPPDIIDFLHSYTSILISNRQTSSKRQVESEHSQESNQFDQEFQQKLKAKREKQKNKIEKKNSRKGISAEVFGKYNVKETFIPKIIEKSNPVKSLIKKLLLKSIMFESLNEKDLNSVIEAMSEIKAITKQKIISEGEEGDMLYVVANGEYDCTKVINGESKYLKTYKTQDIFGELSLMYNSKRAATIHCSKPGVLYGLDRSTFVHIVQQSAIKRRQDYSKIISKIEIFSEIETSEKEQICDTLKEERFETGDYIVKEGDQGNKLYFIVQGKLIAEKKNSKTGQLQNVLSYKQGEYFGEVALIKNTVRQASIKTLSKCTLLSISRDEFKRLLGSIEEILKRNMQKYKKFMKQ